MAKHALVIGITQYDYPYNFQSLTKPVHDAEAVARLLDERGGFQKVTRLPEGWNYERGCPQVAADRVTSEQLMQALQTFLEEAGRGDALIYFSGHGFVVPDKLNQRQNRKKGYLVTSDSQIETIAVHGIPFDSLNDFFHDSNLNSLVLLLDCCHAGSYLERDLVEQTLTAFGSQKDYYLMAACRATEKAYEGEPEQENSVFTAALLEGLAQERADQDGQISCDRLFDFIYKNQKLRNFGQQPIRLGLGGSITLVNYPIENKEPAKLNRQNPYQGLRAFDSAQANYFYGRDRVIRELLVRLNKDRFLSVIGPSGSGKSSVVKAGLLPQLKSNRIAESSQWDIESFTPGRHPLTPLQEIFARQHRRNQPYVLFIDQFEEVFTLCENEEERQTFLRLITDEATSTERLARVIWAMRGDFLDRCAAYPEPATLINSIEPRTYIVPPFSLQELEEAIKKPAERHGVTFEEGLIAQILEDVEGEPGALPLLQYALSQLWQVCVENSASEQPQLTKKGYKEIGGVKGALNETANNLYHTRLPEDQVFIRDLFMQLVQVEEDTVTRRPISWERLDAIANSPEQAQRVVGLLANQRLLVTDEKNVQVVHEALLSEWVLLRKWIEDNREDIRLSRRLEAYCREWQESFNQAENALLPDAWLAPIEDWVKRTQHKLKLTPLEAEYLQKSIEKRDRDRQAALERIESQLQQERTLRKVTQSRLRVIIIAGSLLAALATTVLALSRSLVQESRKGELKALVVQAQTFSSNNQQLEALMASVKALNRLQGIDRETIDNSLNKLRPVIQKVWEANRLENPSKDTDAGVLGVSFNQNGTIVTAHRDGTIILWGSDGEYWDEAKSHSQRVWTVKFSHKGQLIASTSLDNTVKLWRIEGRKLKEIKTLHHQGAVYDVRFSSDDTELASSSRDGTLKFWYTEGQNTTPKFIHNAKKNLLQEGFKTVEKYDVNSVDFNPSDNSIIAYADNLGRVMIWNRKTNQLSKLDQHKNEDGIVSEASIVRFSQDKKMLASSGFDGVIKIFKNGENGQWKKVAEIKDGKDRNNNTIYGFGFSPNSKFIAAGGLDEKVKIWDINQVINQFNKGKNSEPIQVLEAHTQRINRLDFFDDQTVASPSQDNTLRIWKWQSHFMNTDIDERERLLNYACAFMADYLRTSKKLPDWFADKSQECPSIENK